MSARANPVRVFDLKVRGIRWIEIFGVLLVAALVLSVYVAKAAAAREGARIADLERQIAQKGERVRLLRAEVARLEQPGRLEVLARGIGLAPVDVHRQTKAGQLAPLAIEANAPKPVEAVAPTAPPAPSAAPAPEAQR